MSKLVEEWRDIAGYEGLYQVSDWGRVRSIDRVIKYLVKGKYPAERIFKGQIIAPFKINSGYLTVSLGESSKGHNKTIHRLVAEAFIPNTENKPCVGHKDGNETNNCVENLYWCTYPENNNHPITKERQIESSKKRDFSYLHTSEVENKISKSLSKPIIQLKDGVVIKEWDSIKEAASFLGKSGGNITCCCQGKFKSMYGYQWMYKEDYEKMINDKK